MEKKVQHSFIVSFKQAIGWNALFYTLYKISFVLLTAFLYTRFSAADFSRWATVNSIVFLFLLWLNCGFKKSIPRFAPLFRQDKKTHQLFIASILLIKIFILCLGIPVLWTAISYFVPDCPFLPLIIGMFLTEGLASLFLLIYHAHFLQKEFNIIQSLFLLLETLSIFSYFFLCNPTPDKSLFFLFASKIVSSAGICLLSLFCLPLFYKKITLISQATLDAKSATLAFIKHSFFMWLTVVLQSLSERNFFLPFISFVQGPLVASLFKVVNDAAIFFQRIVLQTVGIADTALLSHIEITDNNPHLMRCACATLFKTLLLLSLPLFSIGIFLFFKNHTNSTTQSMYLFLVLASGAAIEILLSPYARILEVKLSYRALLLSYLPYTIAYVMLLALYATGVVSLLCFIGLTQATRITVTLATMYFAKRDFKFSLPSSIFFPKISSAP